MNPTLIIASLMLIAPANALATDAADPNCMGGPCDIINEICDFAFDVQCLGATQDTQINCLAVHPWYTYCTAAGRAINSACDKVMGGNCVEATGTMEQNHADSAPVGCAGDVCDGINEACYLGRKFLPSPCVR